MIPAVHALHLAEVARRWGIHPEQMLSDLGLQPASLANPSAQITVATLIDVAERARALTHEPALGIYAGMEMRLSLHGHLGFAAMIASDLREAIRIATRFAPTRSRAIALSMHMDDSKASLIIDEQADFGPARDVVLLSLSIGLWQIANALTGQDLSPQTSVDFAFARPAYFDRFPELEVRVRFDQPVNRLVLDARVLDLPLKMADPSSLRVAYEDCEKRLEAMGGDDLPERVRQLVLREEGGCRSVDEIARAIHVSPRTMKRKLASHDLTYSDVLEQQRRKRALLLLRSQSLSLEAIAERLGYSDVANFRRAFRRWTGSSPAAYRRTP